MGKCKNCKYFNRNADKIYSNKFGNCNCNKFVYATSYDKEDIDEKNADQLLYRDYEHYCADFEVGENFGCIHFMKK